MSHSYCHNWVHIVWTTKGKEAILSKTFLDNQLIPLLFQIGFQEGFKLDAVNSHTDHIHCLLKVPSTLSISRIVKMLKVLVHETFMMKI
ncbi:transposase [Flammeovirga pacifica]|uniref:Transposase IS200-like domain-containing protein n=1 Tax=Flammeovirga pacifica TaxID=915059 RepID=A0A1S1YZU5_FLAPC|nr:transposase [Flammeovirga pacifica]OHX66529.1 hypothetical protein NH26_09255 [Flammeovirga pacifica]